MAWSRLQSASNSATAASTVTATFGSNATSGTKIVAFVTSATGSGTVTSVQDAALNSLTQIGLIQGSVNGGSTLACYAMDTPAGDVGIAPAIKFTFSGAGDVAILVLEVSGLLAGNTTAMADGTAGTSQLTPSTSQAQPAYTSTAASEMLFSVLADNGNSVTWALSGYTLDANSIQASTTDDLVAGWTNSTNGAESGTWTTSGTPTGSALLVIAFKIAAGPAPGTGRPLQAPLQPPQPAQPPPGRLIGLTTAAFISGATLSGSGTLTASWTVAGGGSPVVIQAVPQPPQPPQPPPGQITGAAPLITFTVGATLSGSGTLTAGPGVGGLPPVITQAPLPQPAQPPLPPPGRILTGPVTLPGAAALSGSGTLAAAPFFSAAAVLSGSGTLTAGPGTGGLPLLIQAPLLQPAQPPAPPAGRVLTAPSAALLASATLTGSGSLVALPFFSAAAALSGQGTLTAAYTVAGAPPYVLIAVIQPAQPAQPPPGRLLGVPPPPPPPLLVSAAITATASEGTAMTSTVADAATTTATVSEQSRITASVT